MAESVAKAHDRGKVSAEDAENVLGRVAYTTDFDALIDADAVVEAVSEDPKVKGELFSVSTSGCRTRSSLRRTRRRSQSRSWQRGRSRPERVLGVTFLLTGAGDEAG